MKKVHLRFYEELNDFLPEEKKKVRFEHFFTGRVSVKDMIESLGVPHTEIDLILVNETSVGFDYIVNDNDIISIYPEFESLDISNLQHLRSKPLRSPKFVVDVHLGKLARYLRMLGFDCIYKNAYNNFEIIDISLKEKRTILTKDRSILKNKMVTHGYWVRNDKPERQTIEVINRFDLKKLTKEFSRCLDCNNVLIEEKKENIIDKIPPKVKNYHNEFYRCISCKKIYWRGSHYERMQKLVDKIKTGELKSL
jgi:uncharacterized protein with PIN domain